MISLADIEESATLDWHTLIIGVLLVAFINKKDRGSMYSGRTVLIWLGIYSQSSLVQPPARAAQYQVSARQKPSCLVRVITMCCACMIGIDCALAGYAPYRVETSVYLAQTLAAYLQLLSIYD